VHKAIFIALLPIELILSVPLFLAGIRALRISDPGRIGHLALEPDIFLKVRLLGLRRWNLRAIIIPLGSTANECLLDYWSRHIKVIRYPFWSRVLARLYRFPYLQYDASRDVVAINETAPYIAVQRAWGNRPALLALTEKHRREGQARLAEMGIPADAGLICFHCREGGYSPHDEHSHSFRNCSVENYLPAIAELTKRGFWCIRMGDPSMRRIQPMERVIDYAHSDARSDWMDVFLCASCRFFLGSASGLIYLASVFGKPAGSANHAPLSTVMAFYGNDIAIPKLVWSESEGRYLTFSEVFGSDAGNFRYADLYQAHHLKPVENTAEDIRELALEMLERSENRAVYTPEDEELQLRFKALMRPGHYGYGGINRIGRAFLRKYAYLLGDRRG
jgi:putative glycosyltransferase (TIGR04372 family)